MDTHHEPCVKKGPGRPKQFDRDTALDKALALFWRHGYEATSMSDLVACTGAKAPTLYGEFGSKEGLFRAAAERYSERFAERGARLLMDPDRPLAAVVEAYMHDAAAMFTDDDLPPGCFLTCTSATLSASADDIGGMLRSRQRRREAQLLTFFAQRQASGELSDRVDCAVLAKSLVCALHGMAVQAQEGASRADLDGIIATCMAVWSTLVKTAPTPGLRQ